MKLFSWLNDLKTPSLEISEDSAEPEPSISPVLEKRLGELNQIKVTDVMISRALITALDADVQLRRVRRLKSAKVTFFPVYKGDLDHILGWVSKQKVLELLHENAEDNPVANHVRPVGVVNEEATAADLADIFLKAASPFLVVKNSHGTTTGIVTLSEFVEMIFGFELSPTAAASAAEPVPRSSGYEI
ncbi:MAG: CBS domain-containing protein [Bdellovibrionaceae bacterium]|nr:CBS domain-containing protein [Pseudobdellovibrionaceae bacterium]